MKWDGWNDFWWRHRVLKELVEISIIALVVAFFVWLSIVMVGCSPEAKSTIEGEGNQAKTDASATDDGSAKADTVEGDQHVKVVNNSWVPFVIIALALPVMFFAYLWFSKSFSGFGRT